MFGGEYASHIDVLTHSLGEINEKYRNKINVEKNNLSFIDRLKKLYILIFGIPEIGFQIRSLYFEKILNSHLLKKNPKRILDAGCGIGAYALLLGKMFTKAKIIGGDVDKYKLQSCKTIAKEQNIKNVKFEYLNIIKKSNKKIYDLIVCIDVLEHIDRYELALENFSNLLKTGGHLYIHVPQPNQKRLFKSLKKWHHEDHVHDGIIKNELENNLKKLGFKIIISMETFGFFGKLSWELNHIMLSKSFVIAGIIFPLLYVIVQIDFWANNKNGLGIAILAKKE